ncbi:hypothetical protein H5S09_00555 [Limosilactobacillus sp. STM2_1]|uniref:YolD-like family protein n=1 Tax=Limosilactobacillus rudii TaxID=2759755 RepID=A0A7W3UJ65_9LACO|nr:hypothetical protein [Limosilactobacillus rudii]MBB1080041.1 hypothetical protein [Limosilactobacillus rudii]MBB1096471.1 hypothetical protein [Limosilactobacillus rudii]MCD7133528.1 hypothetical protein [Limosilactobacillus rudii]
MENKEQIEEALFSDTSSYRDIMNCSRPQSSAHLPMPREDRAAQFAPFAALTGYHKLLNEIADKYQHKNYPSVDIAYRVQVQLAKIRHQKPFPILKVEYFNGQTGFYEEYTGKLKQINHHTHKLLFEDGRAIVIQNIRKIQQK